MIGSTVPLLSVDVARADIAARIYAADRRRAAAELRRELRDARAAARRARRAAVGVETRHRGFRVRPFGHGSTA